MAKAVVPPIVGVGGFLLLWQLLVTVLDIPQFELPRRRPPSCATSPATRRSTSPTPASRCGRRSSGFWLGLFVALAAATIMAHSRFVEQAVTPLAVLVQVTPLIAYAPAHRDLVRLRHEADPGRHRARLLRAVPVQRRRRLPLHRPATHELLRSVDASKREVFFRLRAAARAPLPASPRPGIAVGLALIGAVLDRVLRRRPQRTRLRGQVRRSRSTWRCSCGARSSCSPSSAPPPPLLIGALERVVLRWHSQPGRVSMMPVRCRTCNPEAP